MAANSFLHKRWSFGLSLSVAIDTHLNHIYESKRHF